MSKVPDTFKNYQFNGMQNSTNGNNVQRFTAQTGTYSNMQEMASPDTSIWDALKAKIQGIKPVIEQIKASIQQAFGGSTNTAQLEEVKYKISEIQEKLEQCKNGEIKLSTGEIIKAEAELERLNNKKNQLEQGGKSNIFSGMLSNIQKILPSLGSVKSKFNQIPSITQKITNNIKQMSTGLSGGLKQVLKYAGVLLGLRSIYNTLKSSASSWLSSSNAQAQQLSANIEYMKYAMR